MPFPLSLSEVSLWLAITSIVLFTTLEMISAYRGKINIYINRRKLRNVTYSVTLLFLATVAIEVISILSSS